ncbi:MAG: tetratricopeptide repeat protein [Roseiflexaceae bacterium]
MSDLAQARALRAAGQHEQARDLLVKLAAQHPQDATVQYEAACVHDSLGLERAAVPYYRAAIRLGLPDAELRGAYLGLGSTLRTLGEYAAAQQTLAEGLERFPAAAELRVFGAMVAYNQGRHHDAVAGLLRLLADTSADPQVQDYARAIRFYADDLDRQWE